MKKMIIALFLLCVMCSSALAINSVITINHPGNYTQGVLNGLLVGGGRDNAMRKLVNYLEGMMAGAYRGTVTFAIGSNSQSFKY
jgi:hypothetical protein